VGLVDYHLDQPHPPQKCLLQNADNISAHLVLHPDELVSHPEAFMCFWVGQYFHKDGVFAVKLAHYVQQVDVCSM